MSESNAHIVIGDKSYPAQIETKPAPLTSSDIDRDKALLRYVPKEPITIEGELEVNPLSLWWTYLFMPSPEVQEVQGVDCDGNSCTHWQYTFSYPEPYQRLPSYLAFPRRKWYPRRLRKRPERMGRKWRQRRAHSEFIMENKA